MPVGAEVGFLTIVAFAAIVGTGVWVCLDRTQFGDWWWRRER
jgi:hypothetical protein